MQLFHLCASWCGERTLASAIQSHRQCLQRKHRCFSYHYQTRGSSRAVQRIFCDAVFLRTFFGHLFPPLWRGKPALISTKFGCVQCNRTRRILFCFEFVAFFMFFFVFLSYFNEYLQAKTKMADGKSNTELSFKENLAWYVFSFMFLCIYSQLNFHAILFLSILLSSAFAGSVASFLTNPLDLAKLRCSSTWFY